jgi:D-3-phosphoglycerate dehydrogenase
MGRCFSVSQFNVLVTDTISEEGIERLIRDGNIEVDVRPGIGNDELAGILGDYDAVITRSGTSITAPLLARPGKLKVIGRAGVGLDNIDIEAASKKGIIEASVILL